MQPGSPMAGPDATLNAGIEPALLESGLLLPPVVPVSGLDSPIAPIFNEDLARVRAVVEAAGGAAEVHWAAGVVVVGSQRQLVVTSDRGRGWMPAGAVLPFDVVLPWAHPTSSRWERVRDPARVVVEYAAAVGGRLAALASTHSSAPAVAAGVPWAFADGSLNAHPELVGGQMVTRFELQICESRRAAVNGIGDPFEQRQRALWVGFDADSRAGSTPVRQAILYELRAHPSRMDDQRWLSRLPWDDLADQYRDTCARERAERSDVRDVEIGALDIEGGRGRALLAQAYADEAVLALRNPLAERALRDAVYSWNMLAELPPLAPPASPITALSSAL